MLHTKLLQKQNPKNHPILIILTIATILSMLPIRSIAKLLLANQDLSILDLKTIKSGGKTSVSAATRKSQINYNTSDRASENH